MKYSQLKGLLRVAKSNLYLEINTYNYKGNERKSWDLPVVVCNHNTRELKTILLLISLTISIFLYGQNIDSKNFIEYDSIISELKAVNTINDMSYLLYRFDFILLLDSSEISLVEEKTGEDIEEFRFLANVINNNKEIIGFMTEEKDIRNVFLDPEQERKIISCTRIGHSSEKVDFPIYVKENKAIFSISGATWSETYYAELKDNNVQIKGIYQIIE